MLDPHVTRTVVTTGPAPLSIGPKAYAAIVSTHDPKMSAAADRVVELHDGVLGVRPHGRHLA